MAKIRRFFTDESGTQVVENGLVLALISISAVAVIAAIGLQVEALYQRLVAAWP